jgi:hypothetical protein
MHDYLKEQIQGAMFNEVSGERFGVPNEIA